MTLPKFFAGLPNFCEKINIGFQFLTLKNHQIPCSNKNNTHRFFIVPLKNRPMQNLKT